MTGFVAFSASPLPARVALCVRETPLTLMSDVALEEEREGEGERERGEGRRERERREREEGGRGRERGREIKRER